MQYPRPDIKFFETIVKPTVTEFASSPLEMRRACIATLVLSSMADHHYVAHKHLAKNKEVCRKYLATTRRDIRLVHDIANATKHCERRPKGFDEVELRSGVSGPAGYGVGGHGWNVAGVWGQRPAIVARNPDGSDDLIDEAIMSVLAYWQEKLASMKPARDKFS